MNKGPQLGARHLQCFMMFLGLACSYCIRCHLSVALVSMTEKSSFSDAPVLSWDSRMKGIIRSSFYWGYIFVLTPAGRISEKFGHKFPLVIIMLTCGVITALAPFAAVNGGFYWMVLTCILSGITQAFIFPSLNLFLSRWAPTEEKGMLFCMVFSGQDFGTVVTMAVAGALADSRWGWPSIFYACGGITMLWALAYAFIGSNSPQEHKTISESEKLYILNPPSKTVQAKDKLETPWRAILSSIHLYAIIIAQCANAWGYYTIMFQAPSYINAVLGFSMEQSGLVTALPYLSSMCAGYVYAVLNYWSNKKNILSKTARVKLWNTYSFWGSALALFLLSFAGRNETLNMTLMVIAVTVNVAFHAGYHSNHIDLAPNFAGTLMGLTTAVSTLCTVATPLYAGFIVTDPKSVFLWQIVFMTAASMFFVGNLFFIYFASAEVQSWNFPSNRAPPDPESTIPKKEIAEKGGDPSE